MNNIAEEYLNEIRSLNGLKNAILSGIAVDKKTMNAEFHLITDRAHTDEEEEHAKKIAGKYLPAAFTPTLKIVKRTPDPEILKERIYAFMKKRFPAASAFFEAEDIHIELLESGANFCFDIASGDQNLFTSGKILDEVSGYLKSIYCGSFYGNVKIVEKEREEFVEETTFVESDDATQKTRFFPIENFKKIDGADELPKFAQYIADIVGADEHLTVCGEITHIQERESKKGNAYYTLSVNDGTGTLRASYFPKKATQEKIAALKAGDWVVLIGANEEFNGHLSYSAKKINLGTPPENFVPEKRPSKPVPHAYKAVFPERYQDYTQAGFFDDLSKPAALKDHTFVVFDLETTGLNNQPSMGKMDKIIEIGAVKMKDGNIAEKFTSFVACPDKLSAEIVELTGIHDEDLIGAPEIDKVIADFFKFVDGAYLVGHNVQFDYRFVKYYGEENGYVFENKEFDTLSLAQELLAGKIGNYKLNTVAGYYGFTFNHHRAFDDALVTAKVFTELVKQKGKL